MAETIDEATAHDRGRGLRVCCAAALLVLGCEADSSLDIPDAGFDDGGQQTVDEGGRADAASDASEPIHNEASADDAGMEEAGLADADAGDPRDASEPDAGDDADVCEGLSCGDGACDTFAGTCECPSGEYFDGAGCREAEACLEDASCDDLCPIPRAPRLDVVRADEVLRFRVAGASIALQVGVSTRLSASQPDAWTDGNTLALMDYAGQRVRVFARPAPGECDDEAGLFNGVYDVRDSYPGGAMSAGSSAVAKDDPRIVAWASRVHEVSYGSDVDESWQVPENALGPAEGTATDVLVLGQGGSVALGFAQPIVDGEGFDFAVYENGFADNFLELAYVEVSSDGVHYARFDAVSLTDAPVDAYGNIEPTAVYGFAGSYRQGYGSPFDLAWLRQHPHVQAGNLDLTAVTHVRIVDMVGDGTNEDSFGRPSYDPYPGTGAAGFDLDAVAVLAP